MHVDLVSLPSQLDPARLAGRTAVIFDVLRATTSMVTAMASGAKEIRVFGSLEAAAAAGKAFAGERLLCGEMQCLPPPGFDMGNSPGEFEGRQIAGKTLLLSTTNGTRAIVAAAGAKRRLAAALVNAAATARCLAGGRNDVILVCSGTHGEIAPEDLIGAGAVFVHLERLAQITATAASREAAALFQAARETLPATLRETAGGQNILRVGLGRDIDFAARLDVFDVAVEVSGDPPIARRIIEPCQSEHK